MKHYKLYFETPASIACSLVLFVLFEFWNNLISHLKRSSTNSIAIEHRQRSFHLLYQIDPNSQILVQYPG